MTVLIDTLNRAQYAGFDFDTFLDELLARTQIRFAAIFNDFAQSSLGIVLFDHIAVALDTLGFYLDRRASDQYLVTARTRAAVAKISRQLGYKMSSAVASSVDLQVTFNQAYAFAVTIPAGFQFVNTEGVIFEVAEDVTFLAGEQGPKTVPAYEGESRTETFVSDGSANQEFQLRRVPVDKSIAKGRSQVVVDGVPWIEEDFLTFAETDQYELATEQEPPVLRFGDGVAGNIPANTASIIVTYVATLGANGRVGEGTITDTVTSLVVNFQTIDLSVTNPEGASGGSDRESLESARAFAGRVFKSRQVGVTREDYEALAGSFADPLGGRVAVAQAFVSRDAGSDLTVQNEILAITETVTAPVPVVDQALADAGVSLDTIDQALSDLSSDFTDIGNNATSIDTNLQAAITSARLVKNRATEISTDANDIKDENQDADNAASTLETLINGYTTAGSTQLTAGDKAALLAEVSAIQTSLSRSDSEADQIVSAISSLNSSVDSQIAAMGQARDLIADIGLSIATVDSNLESAEANRLIIVTEAGVVGPPATGLREDLETIDAAVEETVTEVASSLEVIDAHFDKILSDDCKTNVVTVPILVTDAAGFYTGPSTKLLQELQTYLDARKEVTQVVAVTSGERFLVAAVISVRVGVSPNYSESVIKAAVEAAVDGVLRGRDFGASLYEDELYNAIAAIDGVAFTNAVILGEQTTLGTDATRLDADGNLIITSGEVVTKGTVTVTPEAA